MNTAIFSPSGGSVGVGFAIPAATIDIVVRQLQTDGQVTRGYLGVQVQPLTQELAEGMNIATQNGALIDSAQGETPAAKAGLKAGDVITAVNGKAIVNPRELTRQIGALKPGAKVQLTFLRQRAERTVEVELGSLPVEKIANFEPGNRPPPHLGLEIAPAAGAAHDGVDVIGVDPDGSAAENGIRVGDVILEIAGRAVSTPDDVKAGLSAAQKEGRKAILFTVKGPEGTRFVAIATPKTG
jgi:serine protease Do